MWYRQKTTWTGIAGLVAAVGGYLTGEITAAALVAGVLAALGVIFMRQGVAKVGGSRPLSVLAGLIVPVSAVALLFGVTACGTTAGGGPDSPGTAGAPATATGVVGAQNARDLGLGETPQSATTGTASILWKFASEGDARVMMRMLEIAESAEWSAEQIRDAFQALNGAPEDVRISITGGKMEAISGHAQQTGATAGQGGASRDAVPTPTNN